MGINIFFPVFFFSIETHIILSHTYCISTFKKYNPHFSVIFIPTSLSPSFPV